LWKEIVINPHQTNNLEQEGHPMNIFHIAKKEIWENALSEGMYQPEGFNKVGFIHCSELDQVLEVANTFYRDRSDLVLLEIDTHLVNFPIKYESAEGSDERFPHLYGPLMKDAVVHVYAFTPDNGGEFRLPEELSGSGA
jgi:uncharacterized protein (DUF952 family)